MLPLGLRRVASFAAATAVAAPIAGLDATGLAEVARFGGAAVRATIRVATARAVGAM